MRSYRERLYAFFHNRGATPLNVAFGLAAIGMLASLINFNFTKRRLGPIGLQPGHPDAIVKRNRCLNGQSMLYMGNIIIHSSYSDHGFQN